MRRNIAGVLLLDKPAQVTSNQVLQVVKKLFGAHKAGHTGSLDPIATGMLPLCFGRATKFAQFLLEADKRYIVTGKLGEVTTSADSEGEIIATTKVPHLDRSTVTTLLTKFQGKIFQVPPMYSAIKYRGQPLYKLARQGIVVPREPRAVTIYTLSLLELEDNLIKLAVSCSKGTYVRTLVADIGQALGCGAHVVALRRTAVGPYQAEPLVTLERLQEVAAQHNYQLLEQLLLPLESLVGELPRVTLTPAMSYYMGRGEAVLVPQVATTGLVALQSKGGGFLGVGEVVAGKVVPRKLCLPSAG